MKTGKAVIILLVSLVLVIFLSWFFYILPVSKVNQFFANLPNLVNSQIISNYPSDLTVTISKGIVSINQPSPYCLLLHQNSGVIFDAEAQPSLSALGANSQYSNLCQPIALVGSNFVMYPDDNSFKISQIPTNIDFALDQPTIKKYSEIAIPIVLHYGRILYYLLPVVFIPFALLFILFTNLWYKFTTKLILKIFKVDYDESYIFGTSLFLYTVIIILNSVVLKFVSSFIGQEISLSFPFANTIIIALVSLLYFKSRPQSPPGNDPTPTPPVV